jgi:hypothetical protein
MYMNKLNNPGRKIISAPIQIGGETNDHATALGQAVAMENIQTQLELQSQLMGQVQGKRKSFLFWLILNLWHTN